ncbi:MAG: 2-hydroxyacyl-CoA dehydratase [Deltaproteobacteria bacterium]|nr:2-hydroxyacyl-CoA dehydratase [Deltaproteobacteria bacterium]
MASENTLKGLAKAKDVYEYRSKRARELKTEGKKVLGYFCCYPPLEIMTALDFLPIRILGDMDEPITIADGYLPTVMCIFYRSCFDLGMKGRYDFLDGFIGAHACDGAERTSHIWKNYIKSPCNFFLDIPHTSRTEAVDYFKLQLSYFKETLEEFTGKKISPERIRETIALHNKQRALVRDLYNLRKPDPPLISGSEMLQVVIALMMIPIEEGNVLLKEVIEEVSARKDVVEKKTGRLLIWGSLIDNTAFTDMIESAGFNIVIEDTALGVRPFWHDIEDTEDPLMGLAKHYLEEVKCPRTFAQTGSSYKEDLENRFSYLKEFANHWKVNGVFGNIIRNCDIHGYEVPAVRDYLEGLGLPVLIIEQDYSTAALEPLRTRFQAFAERIS